MVTGTPVNIYHESDAALYRQKGFIMFKTIFPLCMNLQLFAEGGAEGAGETGAAAASQNGESPAQGTEQTSAALTITEEQFKELMKDKNSPLRGFVDKHTEGIVRNRLKGTKETITRYEALNPVLELFAQRYNTTTDDPNFAAILTKAAEEDDSFFAAEAEKRGIDVETMKRLSKAERENTHMKKVIADQENQRKADELLRGWMDQAEKLKETYPSFDLKAELENPDFIELMRSPLFNVQSAYEFIHRDELKAAAAKVVAQQMEQRFANKMASNANFPAENGVASTSAAVASHDVRNMTKAERDAINRRVARGEHVTMGGNLVPTH